MNLIPPSLAHRFQQLSPRDRNVLTYGSIAALLMLFIKFALIPYLEWRGQLVSDIQHQKFVLQKMAKSISERDTLLLERARNEQSAREISTHLLRSQTPDLASAELITLLRRLSSQAGIATSRISTGRSKNKDTQEIFKEIVVSIPSMRCDMKQLNTFLVNIANAPQLLLIRELRVRVTNMRDPRLLSVNVEIAGFMKNTVKDKESVKSGQS